MTIETIQINDVAGPIIVNAGFIIIAEKKALAKHESVVMGVRANLCEYVTWSRFDYDSGPEFYSGHYFREIADALKDFQTRI